MIVEKLIEKLKEVDPNANVVLEIDGEEAYCAPLHDVIDDDNGAFVLLTLGDARIPMKED